MADQRHYDATLQQLLGCFEISRQRMFPLAQHTNLLVSLHGCTQRIAHLEKDNTHRVHVHFVVVVARNCRTQLRGYIQSSTNAARHVAASVLIPSRYLAIRFLVLATSSQAEIADLGHFCHIDEYVVWLEVTVDNTVTMDMSKAFQNLPEESPVFFWIVIETSANKIAKSLLLTKLHLYVQDRS